ncbi:MAG TPA: transglutaminase domain-containing protein [Anaerohalosphaeraceae bacterium]|nr:transglutaminase domain-containing protein [Anaerohalosphaeraceae bacterium]HRT52089.1 transglutaminase domain-containing protein [Anaerohalosphaeraceae bacterium]HRT88154.1 transglutaminase domain-containing protein [Anaerohalosphaeraceae bacterium]
MKMLCKAALVCCVLACSFVCIAVEEEPAPLALPFRPSAAEEIDYSQRRGEPVKIRATRQLKITAGKDHKSKNNIVAIYVGLPVVDASQDNVVIEAVDSKAAPNNVACSLDGRTLWIEYIDVEPGFVDDITITFSVDLYERRAALTSARPYDTSSPLYQRYTTYPVYDGSEAIDVNRDFQLLKAARISPAMEPVDIARRIYNYLRYALSYGKPATISEGEQAHCGTYAALFVRLCQAAGVPARRCAGFALAASDDDKLKTTVSGHNWAEFYVEGSGWIPVDPTMGDKTDSRQTYYFGAVDNARLCVSKSGYHDQLPLRYKRSAADDLLFTYDASSFERFKCPDTIQGVHRFQFRYDLPIQISVPDPYGPSLRVLSRDGMFTKPAPARR